MFQIHIWHLFEWHMKFKSVSINEKLHKKDFKLLSNLPPNIFFEICPRNYKSKDISALNHPIRKFFLKVGDNFDFFYSWWLRHLDGFAFI